MMLLQLGAHRGATCVHNALTRQGIRPTEIVIADPKGTRSVELADRYRRVGIPATALVARAEDVVARSSDARAAVVSIDDLGAMAAVTRRANRTLLVQAVGQGPQEAGRPPTAIVGITAASFADRLDDRATLQQLLDALADLSPPSSSTAMRADPISADRLQATRQRTSDLTVDRLRTIERTHEDRDLARLLWNQQSYPLVVVRRGGRTEREDLEQALDSAAGRSQAAVALVSEARVNILVVEAGAFRHHRVRLALPFERLAPTPPVRVAPGPAPALTFLQAASLGLDMGIRTARFIAEHTPPRPAHFTD